MLLLSDERLRLDLGLECSKPIGTAPAIAQGWELSIIGDPTATPTNDKYQIYPIREIKAARPATWQCVDARKITYFAHVRGIMELFCDFSGAFVSHVETMPRALS
jgi:hypothetical protein